MLALPLFLWKALIFFELGNIKVVDLMQDIVEGVWHKASELGAQDMLEFLLTTKAWSGVNWDMCKANRCWSGYCWQGRLISVWKAKATKARRVRRRQFQNLAVKVMVCELLIDVAEDSPVNEPETQPIIMLRRLPRLMSHAVIEGAPGARESAMTPGQHLIQTLPHWPSKQASRKGQSEAVDEALVWMTAWSASRVLTSLMHEAVSESLPSAPGGEKGVLTDAPPVAPDIRVVVTHPERQAPTQESHGWQRQWVWTTSTQLQVIHDCRWPGGREGGWWFWNSEGESGRHWDSNLVGPQKVLVAERDIKLLPWANKQRAQQLIDLNERLDDLKLRLITQGCYSVVEALVASAEGIDMLAHVSARANSKKKPGV